MLPVVVFFAVLFLVVVVFLAALAFFVAAVDVAFFVTAPAIPATAQNNATVRRKQKNRLKRNFGEREEEESGGMLAVFEKLMNSIPVKTQAPCYYERAATLSVVATGPRLPGRQEINFRAC